MTPPSSRDSNRPPRAAERSLGAVKALQRSEEHFRALVENIGDVVCRFDRRSRFLYVNPACLRFAGFPPEYYTGKTHSEVGLDKDAKRWDEAILRVYRTAQAEEHKRTVRLAKGTFTFNWRAYPEFGPDGTVVGVVSVSRDITDLERTAQQLQQNSRRLRAVSRRLVEIQESERRRLSAELHDLLGQNMTALGINLDIVKGQLPGDAPSIVSDRIVGMRTIVGEMVDTLRMVLNDLRPASIESYGLSGALHGYARTLAERTGFLVRVSVRGTEVRLEPELALSLFRIAQEALQNSARHSGADGALAELVGAPGMVRLVISDAGCGFRTGDDRRGRYRGFGLILMQERADAIGAMLHTESTPGAGTRVIVELTDPDGHQAASR